MNKSNKYFEAPFFTPRERLTLRALGLRQWAWDRWLSWRYRDRLRLGPGARIDAGSIVIAGTGTVELGEGMIIEGLPHKTLFHLAPESVVSIGAASWFQLYDAGITFSTKPGARIELGQRCWFSGGIFGASKEIIVGDHTLIGFGCLVLDSSLHRMDNDQAPVEPAPVRIGSHVWMPSYVTVLRGVTIGDHCVIGTGSLVASDIPPNSFAAGRPAKVIRQIGDRDQVE